VQVLTGAGYDERTEANVRDSDATVIMYHRDLKGGTLHSYERAGREHKPLLLLDMQRLSTETAARQLSDFITRHNPGKLNFSGPRASEWPDGYRHCYALLEALVGSA
jgi:hypothetical protein